MIKYYMNYQSEKINISLYKMETKLCTHKDDNALIKGCNKQVDINHFHKGRAQCKDCMKKYHSNRTKHYRELKSKTTELTEENLQRRQLEDLKEENFHLRTTNDELQQQNNELSAVAKLEKDELLKSKTELSERFEQLKLEDEQNEKERNDLERSVRELKQSLQSMKEKYNSLSDEKKRLSEAYNAKNNSDRNNTHVKTIEELTNKNNTLLDEKTSLIEERSLVEEENVSLQKEIEKLNMTILKKDEEYDALEKRFDGAKDRVGTLEDELQQYKELLIKK